MNFKGTKNTQYQLQCQSESARSCKMTNTLVSIRFLSVLLHIHSSIFTCTHCFAWFGGLSRLATIPTRDHHYPRIKHLLCNGDVPGPPTSVIGKCGQNMYAFASFGFFVTFVMVFVHNFVLLHFSSNKAFSSLYQSVAFKQSFVGTAHMNRNTGRDIY
jgi:hypothetical protein